MMSSPIFTAFDLQFLRSMSVSDPDSEANQQAADEALARDMFERRAREDADRSLRMWAFAFLGGLAFWLVVGYSISRLV